MKKGYIYLLLTALFWSFAGICIRFNNQSALLISVTNAGIGISFNLIFNHQKVKWNKTILFASFCQFIMGITFICANQLTTVGNAIILQYTSMIFVLIYQCIDKRKLPKLQQIGIIFMVILGMILFFFDSISFKGMLGNIIAILSGAFYGLQFYVNTKEKADPYSSMIISFIFSLLLIGFVIKDFRNVTTVEWTAMAGSGLICAGLGSLCFARGIVRVNAFTANIICMLEIVFAPIWAYLIFQEVLGPMSFIGAIVMVTGIVGHLYLENKKIKKKSAKYDISLNQVE
ncbi:DMT family transporter [Beduini massiliensis]|uniref:DMT family transporter n=1 Tax=Beduini massiliensis TaxID=1585974 RepID=UPI00059A8DC5|nr:DMT family transporter [Beduini massiliensis]